MFQIVKTPVWLRVKFARTNALFHRLNPRFMPQISTLCVKRNQNLSLFPINHNFEAAIASRLSVYSLPETHLSFWILLAVLLMRPAIFWQKHLRHEANGARRGLNMKKRCKRG